MKNKRNDTVKDDQLREELKGFEQYVNTLYNKTLYAKFRVKKPLKPRYKQEILSKIYVILKTHIGTLPSTLTKEDIDRWVEYSYSRYKTNGNNARFLVMNHLVSYLGCESWRIKLPPLEQTRFGTLTEEERQRYIEAINRRCNGILDKDVMDLTPKEQTRIMERAILLIQTMTVCRPTEIISIETQNIDFERHKITLEDSKTHEILIRIGLEDSLILNEEVEESLRHWLKVRHIIRAKRPEHERYLFLHPEGRYKGQVIEYNKILRLCKAIGVEAGITSIRTNPYTLKRTEISRDCDRNPNIRIPQIRARHTDFNSTMRYNNRTVKDATDYVRSERYETTNPSLETQMKKLAEKVTKGEIPIEIWQQLRADLLMEKPESKKKTTLIGYG